MAGSINCLVLTVLVLLLLAGSGVAYRCCLCKNAKQCRRDYRSECTTRRVNGTLNYFQLYAKNVPSLNSSQTKRFECINHLIRAQDGDFHYKGCIYSDIQLCNLDLQDRYKGGSSVRKCKQGPRNCNSAWSLRGSEVVMSVALLPMMGGIWFLPDFIN